MVHEICILLQWTGSWLMLQNSLAISGTSSWHYQRLLQQPQFIEKNHAPNSKGTCSETLQRGAVEAFKHKTIKRNKSGFVQTQTLKVRSLAAWRITSQSVRMMRPASFELNVHNASGIKLIQEASLTWHEPPQFMRSEGTAVQIEALHCVYPKIRYAHKPFCSLCRTQRQHWTHTCYSRKGHKTSFRCQPARFLQQVNKWQERGWTKKVLFWGGDSCSRYSVYCANSSK